jgi:hypothetical protein
MLTSGDLKTERLDELNKQNPQTQTQESQEVFQSGGWFSIRGQCENEASDVDPCLPFCGGMPSMGALHSR